MSCAYEFFDRGLFDYNLQPVSGLPLLTPSGLLYFRAPAVNPERPYGACLGGAHTFGRFVPDPYPAVLARRLGIQVQNLGVGGVGPRFFDHPDILGFLNGARFVVVQILSARSVATSRFDNRLTCGPTGIAVADGQPVTFDAFFAKLVASESPAAVRDYIGETRERYAVDFRELLNRIAAPKVLLWWSARRPEQLDARSAPEELRAFPDFVDGKTVESLRSLCNAYVEVVSSTGLPQVIGKSSTPIPGARCENGTWINDYYPSPAMHLEVAAAVRDACQQIMQDEPRRGDRHSD